MYVHIRWFSSKQFDTVLSRGIIQSIPIRICVDVGISHVTCFDIKVGFKNIYSSLLTNLAQQLSLKRCNMFFFQLCYPPTWRQYVRARSSTSTRPTVTCSEEPSPSQTSTVTWVAPPRRPTVATASARATPTTPLATAATASVAATASRPEFPEESSVTTDVVVTAMGNTGATAEKLPIYLVCIYLI